MAQRNNRPDARRVPNPGGVDRLQALAAAKRIRSRSASAKLGRFDWKAFKVERDAGRP
jgi:hypothetical protein